MCLQALQANLLPSLPPRLQIRFFLLQNRQGKTRMSKWYNNVDESEKRRIEAELHRLVTQRDSKYTNFVEVGGGGGAHVRWLDVTSPTQHFINLHPIPLSSAPTK